jgi:hypothetical protein
VDARGYDSDELSGDRITALNYYNGVPRGDELPGRSAVQSLDVHDHVQATMAQLSGMMKATLIEFEPDGQGDEDAAQMESDIVMSIAEKSDAFTQFSDAAFDALLQRNGWIHCYVDEVTETWEDEYEGLDDMGIQEALTPVADNDMMEVISLVDGDLKVKHTMSRRCLQIESVAPEWMLFASGHKSMDVSDIRFIAQKQYLTKSELIESGLSKAKVDTLPTVDYQTWEQANVREFGTDSKLGGEEKSTHVVECYNCYAHIDVDEDGISELWHIRVAGYDASIMLDKERARFVPFCTGTAIPMPHRTTGNSLFDALKEIQDAKTFTLRQLLDNSNIGNNIRLGLVEGEANYDDALSSAPGTAIRMRSEGAIFPIPFNDVGGACQSTLNYLDAVATSRAGAAVDLMAGEFQLAAAGAQAVQTETGHKEKMSAYFARNIIQTLVKGSYKLIHQALRSYMTEPVSARLAGQWVTANPKQWKPRKAMRVIAGLSGAERREKAQALAQNIQYQSMALQAGMDGSLVTPSGVHESLRDWLRVVDLDHVDSYYVDPASEEAAQATQAKQQAQEAATQKQDDLAKRLVDQEQQLDKYKHDSQLVFDKWEAELKAAVEEMKITGSGIVDLEVEALKQSGQNNGETDSTSGSN